MILSGGEYFMVEGKISVMSMTECLGKIGEI